MGKGPDELLEVRPALSWKASILHVKDVPEGALVGYNGSFRAERPLRIAVIRVLAAAVASGIFCCPVNILTSMSGSTFAFSTLAQFSELGTNLLFLAAP